MKLFQNLSSRSTTPFSARNKHAGFTLVELLVVFLLVGILTMLAVPSFRATVNDLRASSEANAVVSAFRFVREEANKRGTIVTITSPAGEANLASGWVVFTDSTRTYDRTTASNQLLAVRDDVANNMIINVFSPCSGGAQLNATFSLNRLGECSNGDSIIGTRVIVGVPLAGSPTVVDPTTRRAVCMTAFGRMEVRRPAVAVTDANACTG
jgi:prepilin-type N-terminal cleavage/methylation domain-containing protein